MRLLDQAKTQQDLFAAADAVRPAAPSKKP
jgi:hypothetical protein